MSKKKEKRIKRLRKYSLWPQIIETILVEVAFIVAVVLIFMIDIVSMNTNLVTIGSKDCDAIVEYVGKGWDSQTASLSSESETELNNIVKYNSEAIGGINILDDDFKLLYKVGGPDINDSNFKKDFDLKSFEKNGLFFSEESADLEEESADIILFKDSENYDSKTTLNNFHRLFWGLGDINSKEEYKWATTRNGYYAMWILYKTEIPGVNAAVLKRGFQSEIDMGRYTFMGITLLIVFAFIYIYEHYKLVLIILQRRKIKKIIYTDTATGGNNKDFFVFKTQKLIKRSYRSSVIVYLRMEKFRNYTTAYGIKAGDNLLEDFYKKLTSLIKKRKELAAHLEKGDFVLFLHYDNEELLNIRMQAITQALNDCRPKQHLFFSVGACRILTRVDVIEEKISNAGAAISKQEGSSSVLWFDEAMREEQVWERLVEDDMDRALAAKEFKVYLQPKYSTKKEELSAAEALVRWIHPEYGFVSPGKFIPIFERNGFITKLDDYMLEEVSKLQASWLAQGKKLVPISVNVSRAHFSQYDLAEHICSIVDTHKVPHEYIELELTESAFFDDKQVLLDTIKKLKNYGFKVSMDDFGAGYSSLNSLKELPLDIIKLDAQFFRDIEDKKRADLIVCDTIKLAKKLGMQIVAEGIETREQVDFLAEQKCDLIQGFYFAKPLPIEEFEAKAFS